MPAGSYYIYIDDEDHAQYFHIMEIIVTVNSVVWKKYIGSFNFFQQFAHKVVFLKDSSVTAVIMEIWLPIKLVEILLPILAHQHKHQHKPLFLKDSIYSYFIEVVDPIQLLLSQIPTLAPTIQTSLKIIIKLS